MYFLLEVDSTVNNNIQQDVGQNSHVSLVLGEFIDAAAENLELPYRFELSVSDGEVPHLHAYYPGSDVMQQVMIDVLRANGVDNLQVFPTVVRRQDSGEEIPGYSAVNIVGTVACADMTESNAVPFVDVCYFHDLVIDPMKTRNLLMFRVAESSMLVLVHEKVAKGLEAANLPGLLLTPVKEAGA